LQRREIGRRWTWVARCLLTSKELSYRTPCLPKGFAWEAGANAENVVASKEPRVHSGARIGRSRGVPARRYRYVAEVDKQRWVQRSARFSVHPIWGASRDGSLVRSHKRASKAPRGGRDRINAERRIDAETHHVTVFELGGGSRRSAGASCRWKAPRIAARLPHLHGGVYCAV
jgi:hypothetical protein